MAQITIQLKKVIKAYCTNFLSFCLLPSASCLLVLAPIKPGNLQVHWREGNVLLDRNKRSPEVEIPDYNALVRLEKQT